LKNGLPHALMLASVRRNADATHQGDLLLAAWRG
jgi:hypothetical protein